MDENMHFDLPGDEPVIRASRVFDAPREKVWAAFTLAEHVARWWGPSKYAISMDEWDLRPGGKWQITHSAEGRAIVFAGEFREVVKPARLVRTSHFNNSPDAIETLELAEMGGKTRLTMISRFPDIALRDAMLAGGRMQIGAREAYARLDALLKTL
jgi:uncharacterized protein YndB with AHSA1/START domain